MATMDIDNFDEVTYQPLADSYALDEAEDFRVFPLQYGHAVEEPRQNLGALDALPLELIQSTLSLVDLETLQHFRRVNRRALKVVDGMPEYKAVATFAQNALRGIQIIKADRWNTCEALYKAICTAECETCGDFGGYLYLLTCKRVCFLCFTHNEIFRPLSFSYASEVFDIRKRDIKKLPHMENVPGAYSFRRFSRPKRRNFVDHRSVCQESLTLHGSTCTVEQCVPPPTKQEREKDFGETRMEMTTGGTGKHCPERYIAIVRAPALNPATRELEFGVHCVACRDSYHEHLSTQRYRKYTRASFAAHLAEFGPIERTKHIRR
ncbi:hypothetical protein IWX90DRAFT_179350 [Phyllosticta citrichinensis]|uniref:F-box domain-containing protein n=1 Tax=Phyllosticta citrichinensis TaxID=1130410 RepID=A0ABR1XVU0_9PEZI